MEYHVCLEQMEARWIAHVPALFGCFYTDDTREAALAGLPAAIGDYFAWKRDRGDISAPPANAIAVEVDEIHRAWILPPNYEVNAFFAADAPPLSPEEIAAIVRLLEWTRADLLSAVAGLTEDELSREIGGERWPLRGILQHVGGGEWWYLDRIHLAFPREEVPEEPFARLEKVRTRLRAELPGLAGANKIVEREGELWSPRKMIRRAVWHERDHTAHIWKLLTASPSGPPPPPASG